MALLWDFKCGNCGTMTEELVSSGTNEIECPECGAAAKKRLAAPRLDYRMGVDPTSSVADRWARMHESRYREGKRKEKEHGDKDW